MTFLVTLGICLVAVGLSVVMINIRHIITGKEFRGTCSSNNPMLKNQVGECTVCGKKSDEECKMPDPRDRDIALGRA